MKLKIKDEIGYQTGEDFTFNFIVPPKNNLKNDENH
jgi:hypothetical protein